MKKRRNLLSFALIALLITSQGCFDIRREIKIYPNGSGEERIYVTIAKPTVDILNNYSGSNMGIKKLALLLSNEAIMQQDISTNIQHAPGISLKEVRVTTGPDDSKDILVHYTFDEPSALVRTIKEMTFNMSNMQNVNFTLLKFSDEDDELKFKYILRNASRSYDDQELLSLFSGTIQSSRVSYTIDMPFEVLASNSTSQSGNTLYWDFALSDILYGQAEMTASLKRETGIDLPFAEKIDKSVQQVTGSKNPLIRLQVYNANKEPVKVGSGIILKDGLMVTNFRLLTLVEGQSYFSILLNDGSLAGIDEMRETDYDRKLDIAFFRFNNNEPSKTLKFAALSDVRVGEKVKIYYHPNTLGPTVYSMDGTITGVKPWGKKNKVIEVKPAKPLGIEGGGVFKENGDLIGMVTNAYEGEVGKLYLIPADYIRLKLK